MTDLQHELAAQVDRATPGGPPPYDDVLARRGRRRARRRTGAAVVGGVAAIAVIFGGSALLQSGDGSEPNPAPPAATQPSTSPTPPTTPMEPPGWDGEGVPPLTLLLSDRMIVMAPWSYCYGNTCVDGIRPEHLDDVGSPEQVAFSFPVPGWEFEVTFSPEGVPHPRPITGRASQTSGTTFEVVPPTDPGTYDVNLFGQGGGDVSFTFRWTVG
jgi:hypothetical protein